MWMQDIWEGSNPVLNIKHPCSRERDAFRGQSFKLFLLRNLRLAGIRKVLTGGFSWLWNEISSLLKNAPETLGPYLLEPPPRIGLEENLFGICSSKQRSARVIFSFSRLEWEFLWFNLAHQDETENFWHLISGFETRPRKNLLQSRASRRDRDLLSSFSGFETRTRIPLI